MRASTSLVLAATISGFLTAAHAFEPMTGCFVAEASCAAPRSLRRPSNPGDVQLEAGTAYRLLGANKVAPTHYHVLVPGAAPDARWVPTDCGRVVASCALDLAEAGEVPAPGTSHADNLLAVSWQPAFCETHREKPECASQTPDRFDAAHLALHGLWPQPRERAYCGVDATLKAIDRRSPPRWDLLPELELTPETRAALQQVMPGTQSHLDRHEWIKHGTCYSAMPEEYYKETLQLMAELNASPVRALLAERIGGSVTIEEIRAAFDAGFGEGAGRKVAMDCEPAGSRQLVSELRINLLGEITAESRLADLLAAASEASEGFTACAVDPAGFARD